MVWWIIGIIVYVLFLIGILSLLASAKEADKFMEQQAEKRKCTPKTIGYTNH